MLLALPVALLITSPVWVALTFLLAVTVPIAWLFIGPLFGFTPEVYR